MKKICFVTACRSEYGLMKWIMDEFRKSNKFVLQLIVTGAHLSKDQGNTIDEIENDGFEISFVADADVDNTTDIAVAKTMGRMSEKISDAFKVLSPDFVVVLGDRYELLPICSTALVMRIPIIHFCGGDITVGAIDDYIRNAVTMMSDFHFAGTKDAAENIIRMRNSAKNVWVVGEPGLEAFNRIDLLSRDGLADDLKLNTSKKWALMTFHAETLRDLKYNMAAVKNCITALTEDENLQTVITFANADFGGKDINDYLIKISQQAPHKFIVIPSLGQKRYLSFMKQVEFVIGNSSSGIVEAPFLEVPVINIGDRQKGRYQCENIIQCGISLVDISDSIKKAFSMKGTKYSDCHYWGDGNTAKKVLEILSKEI